jgi:hypothetical protein
MELLIQEQMEYFVIVVVVIHKQLILQTLLQQSTMLTYTLETHLQVEQQFQGQLQQPE